MAHGPSTLPELATGRRLVVAPADALVWILRLGAIGIVGWGAFASVSSGRLGASAWVGLILIGLAQGSVYALLALGYTMVYGVLGFINFAHGEVFMVGAMGGYFVARSLAVQGSWLSRPWSSLLLVLGTSMIVSALVAVALERVAYRPLRASPRLILLVTSIGASYVLQYGAAQLFSVGRREFPDVPMLARSWALPGGLRIFAYQLMIFVITLLMLAGLYVVVQRTRTGRAMRAVAEDAHTAALMGIDVDRSIRFTFALGGGMAGAGAFVYSILFPRVYFLMGFLVGIKAFTAAVLGGIGNLPGAMLGGLLIGLIESLGPSLVLTGLGVPSAHQLNGVLAFAVLILVLIFRPGGLLGERLGADVD